jgi:hypothetical protein
MTDHLMAPRFFHPYTCKMSNKLWISSWIIAAALALGSLCVPPAGAASLTLTFSSAAGGIALGGSGTSASTVAFGSVSAYGGVVPAGVTKSINGTTNWTVSTPINVLVTKQGLGNSANYTLTAQLQTSDLAHTWKLGAATVTSASPATVTATGAYGSATPYTLSLTIPFSASAGSVNNTLNIIVTSN